MNTATRIVSLLIAVAMLFIFQGTAMADDFSSAGPGNWSDTGIWINDTLVSGPPAGPPIAGDTAVIKNHAVAYDAAASGTVNIVNFNDQAGSLTLGRNIDVTDHVYMQLATINLGSFTLSSASGGIQTAHGFNNGGTINRTTGLLDLGILQVRGGTNLSLATGDVIDNLEVSYNSTVTTSAVGNVTTSIVKLNGLRGFNFAGGNGTINLGADLSLTGTIEHTGTINQGNFNITTDTDNGGEALKFFSGVTLTRGAAPGVFAYNSELGFAGTNTLALRADDTMGDGTDGVFLGGNTTVNMNVDQLLGDTTGLTIDGDYSVQDGNPSTINLTLVFDADTPGGALSGDPANFDWAFRMLGDQVTLLSNDFGGGGTNPSGQDLNLFVTSPFAFNVADNIFFASDGYTYVGFASTGTAPEPSALVLAVLGLVGLAVSRRRRA